VKALLVAVAGAAILGAPALASGPSPRTIVQTDKTWVCTGPVDLDSVTVTMTPKAAGPRSGEDAIHLQPGCTGTIGKLTVTTSVADGVKVAAGVHDLLVEGGSIKCLAKVPVLHQDGIQVLGGDRVTFENMNVDCGRPNDTLINSNMFINMAGRSTTPPTDIVCDMCTFGGGAAHTVSVQNSIRSGVSNSTICQAKYPKLTLSIGSGAVDPVNVGNKIVNCGDTGGGGGGSGATKLTLTAQSSVITFGRPVVLTGSFGKAKNGRSVTMFAKPFGAAKFTPVTTLKTDASGGWQLTVHPKIATSYRAVSRASTSGTIIVQVRPLVTFRAVHGLLTVRVSAKTPFRGRKIVIERLRGTRWSMLSRLALGRGGALTIAVAHGARVRVVVPAAPGYVGYVSKPVTVA